MSTKLANSLSMIQAVGSTTSTGSFFLAQPIFAIIEDKKGFVDSNEVGAGISCEEVLSPDTPVAVEMPVQRSGR